MRKKQTKMRQWIEIFAQSLPGQNVILILSGIFIILCLILYKLAHYIIFYENVASESRLNK